MVNTCVIARSKIGYEKRQHIKSILFLKIFYYLVFFKNQELSKMWIVIVVLITFYSPSCLGQETAKGPYGLRVKLPPAHLLTTHGGGFTMSL